MSTTHDEVLAALLAEQDPMMPVNEAQIEALKHRSGRDCGSCSLCCRVLDIDELKKPGGQWCKHCRPGNGGCSIYSDRPSICRTFACRWIIDPSVEDYWFPKHSKMVVDERFDPSGSGASAIIISVDPGYPNRWREAPYYNDIKYWALQGLKQKPSRMTMVAVNKKKYLILSHREVEATGKFPLIFRRGDDHYDCMLATSEADAMEAYKLNPSAAEEFLRNQASV